MDGRGCGRIGRLARRFRLAPLAVPGIEMRHALPSPRKFLVLGVCWWSGFFVMSVELLAGRGLAPDFGNSIYVWGSVIFVFMLALSLGYLAGGRLSGAVRRGRALGWLLIAAALSLVPVVTLGDAVLDAIFDHVRDPRYGSLLGAALLYSLPTAISGAVSPVAIRLLVTELDATGRSAGTLYFVSTFGSAAGTIVTSFYLVLLAGVDHILLGLGAVSLAVGTTAILFGGGPHAGE